MFIAFVAENTFFKLILSTKFWQNAYLLVRFLTWRTSKFQFWWIFQLFTYFLPSDVFVTCGTIKAVNAKLYQNFDHSDKNNSENGYFLPDLFIWSGKK